MPQSMATQVAPPATSSELSKYRGTPRWGDDDNSAPPPSGGGALSVLGHPFTPPAVRPAARCFSMAMNSITTGTVATSAAANRYCHSIMLKELN